jgi:3-methylcrotonyl-CoA carboxylase beta subunit
MIDPAQTRPVVALALSAAMNAPVPDTVPPVFRM